MSGIISSANPRVFRLAALGMLALGCALNMAWLEAKEPSESVSNFRLGSNYGKEVALEDYRDKPVVVLAFLGTECPLARLYGPRLSEMQRQYGDKGVVFLGINSNQQDTLTKLTGYVHRYEINFPMLKDLGSKVAEAVGATRTPEVIVLDQQRRIRYRGRIDDQYGVGVARPAPVRRDLQQALDELLAGKQVTVAETPAVGCFIGKEQRTEPTGEITFTKHIAPILNARCVECHRTGEIGPFTLSSYEDVLGWEQTILEVVGENRMPPWNANPEYGHFKNDPRLTDAERELLRNWVANGMPEGNPEDLPPSPEFIEGWRIPQPDQILAMRDQAFDVPAEGVVDYQRFVVDPGWTEDKFIYAAEARPGNRSVVHHILVYVIEPGKKLSEALENVLVGYAPGSLPVMCEEGVAMKVKAGSKLLFELHYTPNGLAQSDLSYAGVCFTNESEVERLLRGRVALPRQRLDIPAGKSDHVEMGYYVVRQDDLLISMTPHMHLRGKAFRYEAIYPDGSQEILLDVPRYDFNWQLKYILAEPKLLPKGTRIVCTAVYDNSAKNLSNPDPTKNIGWGDQSYDEMLIGFMDFLPPKANSSEAAGE
jgi:peroxiredoxin